MQRVLLGKKQGLVFPVMCNACVKIDYLDNIPDMGAYGDEGTSDGLTTTDHPYGLWGNTGSFSLDAIITPYDVNGSGAQSSGASSTYVHDSKKTMPDGDLAVQYLHIETSNTSLTTKIPRGQHKMAIFYNTNLKLFLTNASGAVIYPKGGSGDWWVSTTQNNPAAYKLEAQITTGSTTTTLVSDDVIIGPSIGHNALYDAIFRYGGMDAGGRLVKDYIDYLGSGGDNRDGTLTIAGDIGKYYLGQELFTRVGFNYTSIGTVTVINGTTVTLSATPPSDISSSYIYEHAPKEIPYVDNSYHVGVSFNSSSRKFALHFNGREIKSVQHSDTNAFQLALEDCFIGSNGSNLYESAARAHTTIMSTAGQNNQFMGVFHELSFTSSKHHLQLPHSLSPNIKNTLLYLMFDEVDI
tara:strand:+ start:1157 stop:2383 length:1227 start_codon:yes stop_codon:yes gene_type:complete